MNKFKRELRIIREHAGDAALFAFPMLLAAFAFLWVALPTVVALISDVSPSVMYWWMP
jgi:hypothetical protein